MDIGILRANESRFGLSSPIKHQRDVFTSVTGLEE